MYFGRSTASSDTIEAEEFSQLLKAIKASDLAPHFGQFVETAPPLWQTIEDPDESYEIIKLLVDLQTTNNPALGEIALNVITNKYSSDPQIQSTYASYWDEKI